MIHMRYICSMILFASLFRGLNGIRIPSSQRTVSSVAQIPLFATQDKLLSKEYSIPFLDSIKCDSGIVEVVRSVDDGRLEILCNSGMKEAPFYIDFNKGKFLQRRKNAQQELVVKALSGSELVVDFTAGMGRDAMILASSGIEVVMVERNYLLYLLLDQALKTLRVQDPSLHGRIHLLHADAFHDLKLLENLDLAWEQKRCSVYLDPMYPGDPNVRKSAVKKDTQILHILAKREEEGNEYHASLISAAFKLARHRVVVKRPKGASWVHPAFPPNTSINGSTQRFDIYFKTSNSSNS